MRLLRLYRIVSVSARYGLDEFILGPEGTGGRLRGLARSLFFWRRLELPRAVRLRQNEERSRVWRRINKALDAVERHRKRMSDAAVRSHFGRRAHHPEVRARFWREDMQRRAKYGEQNDRGERPLWAEVRAAMEQLRVLREEQERTLAELEAQRPSGTS